MVLYLLGRDNVAIKEVKTISSYEIKEDIDFNDSSNIVLADYVHMDDGDFALIKDGAEQTFFGICKEMKPSDSGYKITLKQKENLFDTTIFNDGEELIQSTGMEDYIVKAISDNFISSGDTLMDMDYIQISASTHTPVAAKVSTIVDTDNGVYNLKTFLGNARQNYGIFLDFTVENGAIKIDVNCREQTTLNVDTKLPEVADVSETYSVSVLAKLIVKWDTPKEYATVENVKETNDALRQDTKVNYWLLGLGGIEIPESADLNDYKEPGNYYCSSNVNAATLTNSPTEYAFTMKVSSGTGNGHYQRQEIFSYSGGFKYTRTYHDIDATPAWTNWVRSYLSSEVDNKFLKLTGGTLTGQLIIDRGSNWAQIIVKDIDSTRLHKIQAGTATDKTYSSIEMEANRDGTSNNRSLFKILSLNNGTVPSNVVQYINYVNGTETYYNIYGEHNINNIILGSNLKMKDSAGNIWSVIKLYPDGDTSTNYGDEVVIGAGGNVYVAGGDCGDSLRTALNTPNTENLYLAADESIAIIPNCNTIANRKPIWVNASNFYPATSGSHTLGTSTYKWGQIYSTASSISTSDRNRKHDIFDLDEERAIGLILGITPVTYKYNDGTSNRTHWGIIAQDVEELLSDLGIPTEEFAGFIKSPRERIKDDATGELVLDLDEEGNIQYEYGLRYEEFIAPLIKTVQVQKREIEHLKKEIEKIGS